MPSQRRRKNEGGASGSGHFNGNGHCDQTLDSSVAFGDLGMTRNLDNT
jgi:hypothetical protein